MSRFVFVGLLVALVCFMQTHAAPADAASTTPDPFQDTLSKAQENLNKLFNTENFNKALTDNMGSINDNLSKAFSDAKPKFDELMAKGQEFLDSIIPKSEEPKKTTP